MSDFEKKDFAVFYSDFVTPVEVAGVYYEDDIIFTKEELEIEGSYGIFPVLRSYRDFEEGDAVIINPQGDSEIYLIIAIRPLEQNEFMYILQDA